MVLKTTKTPLTKSAENVSWHRLVLLIVLGVEGAGGVVGGILFGLAPDGHYMDMPVKMMHGTFSDFLVPGFLLTVMGFVSVCAVVAVLKRHSHGWLMAGIAVGGWIIWYTVEIIIIRELHILHLFWGVPVLVAAIAWVPLLVARAGTKALTPMLYCGLASSLWYLAINILVPQFYPGYYLADYTPSELSAFGAPTRIMWVLLVIPYPLLFSSFGWGIVVTSGENKAARITGMLIIAYCMFNLYWPPMHTRDVLASGGGTLSDTLHLVWAGITVILSVLIMGFGAAAGSKQFRVYTIISIALLLVFGLLTSKLAGNIDTGEPTPLIGVWERINIGIFLIWVGVLSLARAGESHKEKKTTLSTIPGLN